MSATRQSLRASRFDEGLTFCLVCTSQMDTTFSAAACSSILKRHLGHFPDVPHQTDNDTARQIALEDASYTKGRERYNPNGKSLDKLAPGTRMLQDIIAPLADRIEAAIDEAKRPGAPAGWHQPIRILPPATLAVIAARAALECTVPDLGASDDPAIGHRVTGLAIRIGRRVHDVARFERWLTNGRSADAAAGIEASEVERGIAHTLGANPKWMTPEVWEGWRLAFRPDNDTTAVESTAGLQLGSKLIELLEQDNMFETVNIPLDGGNRQQKLFCLTLDASEKLLDRNERVASAMPTLLPMLTTPIPWSYRDGHAVGGYLMLPQDLVRADFNEHTKALHEPVSLLDLVALNAIQETPWRINVAVLDVMQEAYDACAPWLDLRVSDYYPETKADNSSDPPHPAAGLIARAVKNTRLEIRERSIRTHLMADQLIVAERLRTEGAIYFPHHRDYRGRCYPIPTKGPSPQGDDAGRALLTFANAMPLGERGWHWLRWWAATCAGLNKAPETDRLAWADANRDLIQRTAQNPQTETEWTKLDDRWQFLAACIELNAAWKVNDPTQFASSLPICFEATCSGLQHLAALAGDATLAAKVNLAGGIRQDICTIVAEAGQKRVDADAADKCSVGHAHAKLWRGKVTRDLVKQPVMMVPYGSTEAGIRRQIRAKLRRSDRKRYVAPLDYMASTICGVREVEMPSAIAIMRWLQRTAKTLAFAGHPLKWTTATGSLVQQSCYKTQRKQIRAGSHTITIRNITNKLDPIEQRNAAAPNFVHALDACLVFLTVASCRARGIRQVGMIHDCFAAPAAQADIMWRAVREQFAALYNRDHLAALAAEIRADHPGIEISDPPARGNFDAREVLASEHAFS
jgi:DNA-directed RNA polymerase, mitochondrial